MSGIQPAGSAYQTEQDEKARQAAYAAAKAEADAAAQEVADAKPVEQPAEATASAITLGTFEPGHDESDLVPVPPTPDAVGVA